MSFSRRLRTIALSQIQAIQERLNRIDAEAAEEAEQKRYRKDAQNEIDDPTDIRRPMRTPEEIASGKPRSTGNRPAASPPSVAPVTRPVARPEAFESAVVASQPSPLSTHYKVLGVEDGADFGTVQAAYNKLAARCDSARFPEGSEDRKMAEAIRSRVDAAYEALRDALDSTAGRFDKLEFE